MQLFMLIHIEYCIENTQYKFEKNKIIGDALGTFQILEMCKIIYF